MRLYLGLVSLLVLSAGGAARAERPCSRFADPVALGAFANPEITESSGLAISPFQAGLRFTHNDSGDSARIFAFDASGMSQGEWTLRDAQARDWEDMAYGPCAGAPGCLFVGDVGDNARLWETVTVYRAAEPMLLTMGELRVDALELTYPDGPRDVEALLVDPLTSDLFLFEKTEDLAARVVVLRDAGQLAAGEYALQSLGSVDYMGLITGGDFGPTGDEAILRGYGSEGRRLLPRRDAEGHVTGFDLLDAPALDLFGEAVSYRSDGLALVTTREGEGAQLYETPCLSPDGASPGPAVGPLASPKVEPPESSGGCGDSSQATLPIFGAWMLWRRRRRGGPWLGALAVCAALMWPTSAQAETEHEVYAALGLGMWPVPEAGAHVLGLVQWQARPAGDLGRFTLTWNTDTLQARYDEVCFGPVCVGGELKGQALFAGLLSDYYQGGQRIPELELSASYVAASGFAELRPGSNYFIRYSATGRRWLFSDFSEPSAVFQRPDDIWVAEQDLSLTYWQIEPDRSQWQPHRLFMRLTGLAAGLKLSAHVRSAHRAWGESSAAEAVSRRNDPEAVILMVNQWVRYGAQVAPRLRLQAEQRFRWGRGEDDLTRDRIGGLNPYVTPLGGAPWAAFLSGRYASGRLSTHVRVWDEVEAGLFCDAVAMQGILRDDSRRFGGAFGAGGFIDARIGDWQADLWLAWAPGLGWGREQSYVAGFASVGYQIL